MSSLGEPARLIIWLPFRARYRRADKEIVSICAKDIAYNTYRVTMEGVMGLS